MPKRSKISRLPPKLRTALNAKIAEGDFTCRELEEWLSENGYEISKSAIAVYSKDYEQELKGVELSRSLALNLFENLPDNRAELAAVTTTLAQGLLFAALLKAQAELNDETLKGLEKALRVIVPIVSACNMLNRSNLDLQKLAVITAITEPDTEDEGKNVLTAEYLQMVKADLLRIT